MNMADTSFIDYDQSTAPNVPSQVETPAAPHEEDQNSELRFIDPDVMKPNVNSGQGLGAALGAGAAMLAKYKGLSIPGGIAPHPDLYSTDQNASYDPESLRRYLSTQTNLNLTEPELADLTGTQVRTNAEIQKGLKLLSGTEPKRTAKVTSINPKTGTPRSIKTYTPGSPEIDTSEFERPPAQTVGSKVMTGGTRLGLAGIAGGTLGQEAQDYSLQQGMAPDEQAMRIASMLGSGALYFNNPKVRAAGVLLKAPYLMKEGSKELEQLKQQFPETSAKIQGGIPASTSITGGANPAVDYLARHVPGISALQNYIKGYLPNP
jgi:hypothetical protein